jgi:hypothetical protein
MNTTISGGKLRALALVLLAGLVPLYGAEDRGPRLAVNLIIDGSGAIADSLDEVRGWISGNLVDRQLREGDRITIWSAGERAALLYSETVTASGKDSVKKVLADLTVGGDTADFAGALRDAVLRSPGGDQTINYTLLVTASPAALSATLGGPDASLVRFSRVQEFRGWRALVIALNIDSMVRRAAAAFLSGT